MLLELLAAVESIDPTTLPLWATVFVAAGMYPLGIMLGSFCSPCCCGCEDGGDLPEALAVSFDGLTKGVNKLDDLLSVNISACFGSGATATVTAPNGQVEAMVVEDAGPLTGITLTGGGSGYAVLGRVQPTGLEVGGGSGAGAEFSITLAAADPDECGRPRWQITAVEVTKAGTGYVIDEPLTISLGVDEFEDLAAVVRIQTVAIEPTLSAVVSSSGGSGAVLAVELEQIGTLPNRWGVDAVDVADGGDGYIDGDPIVFTVDDGTQVTIAVASVVCGRVSPDLEVEVFGPGSGAAFSFTLEEFTIGGRKYWRVLTLTATSPGSGYDSAATLRVKAQPGSVDEEQSYWTATTDGSGGIVGLTKSTDGKFWKSTGVVDFVEIADAGSYYKTTDETESVFVESGGLYYKTDATAPALVAAITVEIVQEVPSAGSGEVITAEVDDDPESPTFGQIVSLSLENGGDGFLEWAWQIETCCISNWNGKTVIATKSPDEPCVYEKRCCNLGTVRIRYNGQTEPPTAQIYQGCSVAFTVTTEPPFTCDGLAFEGVDFFGEGTISVAVAESGYEPDEYPCPGCCTSGESYSLDACSEEDCMEAGGTWWNVCSCGPCLLDDCEGYELIVEVTMTLNPLYVPAGGAETATRTLTLTLANGYSAESTEDGVYVLANLSPLGSSFSCRVNVYMTMPATTLVGFVSAITRSNDCLEPGGVYLPSQAIDAQGDVVCPLDGAVQLCGQPGLMAPGGAFGPGQTSSLLTTVTVVTP